MLKELINKVKSGNINSSSNQQSASTQPVPPQTQSQSSSQQQTTAPAQSSSTEQIQQPAPPQTPPVQQQQSANVSQSANQQVGSQPVPPQTQSQSSSQQQTTAPAQPSSTEQQPAQSQTDSSDDSSSLNKVRDSPQMKSISRESASMLNLLMEQIKALVEISNNLNGRTKESEKRINELTVSSDRMKDSLKQFSEKMESIEKNMEKFIGLYEVVTNQYNPFLESNTSENMDGNNSDSSILPNSGEKKNLTESLNSNSDIVVEDKITGSSTTINNNSAFVPETPINTPQQNYSQPVQPVNNASQQTYSQPVQPMNNFQQQQPAQQMYQQTQQQYPQNNFQQMASQQQYKSPVPSDFIQQRNVPFHELNVASPFYFSNGKAVTNLQDLFEELVYLDDNTFKNHVNDSKHDIANWIQFGLNNKILADKLFSQKTRSGVIKLLSEFIHSIPVPQTPKNFVLSNGKSVIDVEGLLDEVIYMDDSQLSAHFVNGQNLIANWISNTLGNQQLGETIRPLSNKGALIKEITKYLHSQNK